MVCRSKRFYCQVFYFSLQNWVSPCILSFVPWRTSFHILCRSDILETKYSSLCLSNSILILKSIFTVYGIVSWQSVFHLFKDVVPLSSGRHCFWWDVSHFSSHSSTCIVFFFFSWLLSRFCYFWFLAVWLKCDCVWISLHLFTCGSQIMLDLWVDIFH